MNKNIDCKKIRIEAEKNIETKTMTFYAIIPGYGRQVIKDMENVPLTHLLYDYFKDGVTLNRLMDAKCRKLKPVLAHRIERIVYRCNHLESWAKKPEPVYQLEWDWQLCA